MYQLFDSIRQQDLSDLLDILLVAFIIYRVILLIRGTRAMQMLAGIAVLTLVYFGARELKLMTLYWLLRTFLGSLFLILIIIFQRDIRRALTQMGSAAPFGRQHEDTDISMKDIISACHYLASQKIGALIILERETGLKDYIESGHIIDAQLSSELLISLFHTNSPLHDGGIVISQGRVHSAGCVLPLSKNPYISKRLGTRHRAALGISEETDAVVLVISEETGHVSLVQHGAITSDLDDTSLRNRLAAIFSLKDQQRHLWKNWLNK